MGHKDPEVRRAYDKAWKAERRRLINEYKKTLQCERCGFSDYRALTFHHVNPEAKEFEIGRRFRKVEDMMSEIEKCEVLCANCHTIEHFENGRRTYTPT